MIEMIQTIQLTTQKDQIIQLDQKAQVVHHGHWSANLIQYLQQEKRFQQVEVDILQLYRLSSHRHQMEK